VIQGLAALAAGPVRAVQTDAPGYKDAHALDSAAGPWK